MHRADEGIAAAADHADPQALARRPVRCCVDHVYLLRADLRLRPDIEPAPTVEFYGAPLCPAGHLPLKWGDWRSSLLSPIA
ncbi:hypothetical protein FJ978_32585, partial [Mesorhizobium sp. B1-1-7]